MPTKFPKDFIWGAATASYQIEGGYRADGKGLNIWDHFCEQPGKVANADTGKHACKHFEKYEEDVELMAELGIPWYRLSLSWARIVPSGKAGSPVNQDGIAFYNKLIDKLLSKNIQPMVTLYHWDLPLDLHLPGQENIKQPDTDCFLSKDFHTHFSYYADICYNAFGDRVKKWLTFNEPWCICALGYDFGVHAPGRTVDPGVEPYVAGHNLLIAHAHAYDLYVKKYKDIQGGECAITLNSDWFQAVKFANDAEGRWEENTILAQRGLTFILDWFAEPIFGSGDYPEDMLKIFATRPGLEDVKFSAQDKALLHGSSDFFGLNHYTTHFVYKQRGTLEKILFSQSIDDVKKAVFGAEEEPDSYRKDLGIPAYPFFHAISGGLPGDTDDLGVTDMNWRVVPFGFRELLKYIHDRYHPKGGILVTENGLANKEDSVQHALDKTIGNKRIEFFSRYLFELQRALEYGADVRGYFAWSFLDNFEWAFGYEKRFGIIHVDYDDENRKRTKKPVYYWFQQLVANNELPPMDSH